MKRYCRSVILALLISSSLVFIISCGPKPYCDTDLVTLDETRLELQTNTEEADETAEEVAELKKELDDVQTRISRLEGKPEDLLKKINELKKGSGRE